MQEPAIPFNEATRLETLRSLEILDTPPEERFDRVTRLAQRLFNVRFALVTLLDSDRQWFKSSIGFDAIETRTDLFGVSTALVRHKDQFHGHQEHTGLQEQVMPNPLDIERQGEQDERDDDDGLRSWIDVTPEMLHGFLPDIP